MATGTGAAKPGQEDPIDAAADAAKSATDQTASTTKSVRERFRAVRNDEDVQAIAGQARPFVTGMAVAAGMVVDPPITAAYVALRTGRAIQRRRHREHTETPAS